MTHKDSETICARTSRGSLLRSSRQSAASVRHSRRFQSMASASGPPLALRLLNVDQRAGDLAEQPVLGRARILRNSLRVLIRLKCHRSNRSRSKSKSFLHAISAL